jgi:hypothetical protein
MEFSQAIKMRNNLRENHVIMAYNGMVSDELMVTLAELLKNRVIAHDDPKRSKLIFSVFMEGVQNLIWHGSIHDDKSGMILITDHHGVITIMCGNRIAKDHTKDLRERLQQIEGADKDTIRQLYREGMSKADGHEGPGSGLGLLEIARRSSEPIKYSFDEIDEHSVDFIIAATI